MNDLAEFDPATANPFGGGRALQQSSGAGQLQARENTEVMALVLSAKRFPRDQRACMDKILLDFTRPTLAAEAQYAFARGGQNISGPSIRAAEAMRRQWSNLSAGWREVSRTVGEDGVGVSEIEAYCVDYENTDRESIQFVVRHWRDTRQGGYKLKEERDIYELCANQAQRRKRACILAMLPGDVVEAAMNQAEATLKTTADVTPAGVAKLVEAFAPFGVGKEQIEKKLQRKLDSIVPAQVVMLRKIYASLRDGMSSPAEWFEGAAATTGDLPPKGTSTSIDALSKGGGKKKSPPADAPVDQATGEIKKPGKTYAQWVDLVQGAKDADAAAQLLDESGADLSEDQQGELAIVYRTKWADQ